MTAARRNCFPFWSRARANRFSEWKCSLRSRFLIRISPALIITREYFTFVTTSTRDSNRPLNSINLWSMMLRSGRTKFLQISLRLHVKLGRHSFAPVGTPNAATDCDGFVRFSQLPALKRTVYEDDSKSFQRFYENTFGVLRSILRRHVSRQNKICTSTRSPYN